METLSVDKLPPISEYSSEVPAQIGLNSLTIETQDEPIEIVMDAVNDPVESLLTIEYYQKYFNVNTSMVLRRILNSMIPKLAADNYLRMDIGENPDLYGPFWISITLIFSIAISGNIASYLHYASDDYPWHYNFQLVSHAATCILMYATVLPVILWALFKYSLRLEDSLDIDSASYTPNLLSLMCIYGYSLALYIPVSILCVIDIYLMQWFLVIAAALLTGFVLIDVMKPALRNSQYSRFLIFGILTAHLVLSAGFFMYFFQNNQDSEATKPVTKAPVTFKVFREAVSKNQSNIP